MKKLLFFAAFCCLSFAVSGQTVKTELYDINKRFLYDSTGYENVGDWDKKFPVKWKEDRIIMSGDTSINFYRSGTAGVTIKGRRFMQGREPVKWNLMLKGPRMGHTFFSIISSPAIDLPA